MVRLRDFASIATLSSFALMSVAGTAQQAARNVATHGPSPENECPSDEEHAPADASSLLQMRQQPIPTPAQGAEVGDPERGWSNFSASVGDVWQSVQSLFAEMADSFEWANEENSVLTVGESCHLTTHDNCSFDQPRFEKGAPVFVYPAGKTVCLDGSDFFFEVIKGDPDKLHFHLQGGGACWNYLSYTAKNVTCLKSSNEQPASGVFDLENPLNPLRDYTVVVVTYCSGDMHGGDTTQPWGEYFAPVQQRGYNNADSAVKWAIDNFQRLSNLVISGSSAGGLGVQLWAGALLRSFADKASNVAVIDDSFMGTIWPPTAIDSSEAWLFDTWKMCDTGVLTYKQRCRCNGKKLLLSDVYQEAMVSFPLATFGNIQSKADRTQIAFEKAFELTAELNLWGFQMTPGQFYLATNMMLEEWQKHPNFKSYLVDGTQHTFLPNEFLYSATPDGKDAEKGTPTLLEWVSNFAGRASGKTICAGPIKDVNIWTPVGGNETHYCTADLATK